MEAVETSADGENYFCIEYMGDDVFSPTANDVEHRVDSSHSLIQREFEHGKGFYYFCTTCEKSYLNIEDYIESHQAIAKAEEDAINDLIIFEQSEEGGASDPKDVNELVKNDPEDFIDTSENKYFCYDCRTVFKELEDAEKHDCPGVKEVYSENLEQGISDTLNEESVLEFMCAFCENNFQDLSSLEQHQTKCPNYTKGNVFLTDSNEKHECIICHQLFFSLQDLNTHSRSHDNQEQDSAKGTSCHICNITFGTSKRLKLHMKIHTVKPARSIQQALPEIAKKEYSRLDHFFCEICNKSFDQNLLTVHKKMHQHVEKYLCKVCNRNFENAQSYEVHQQRHKSSDGNSSIDTGPTKAMLRNAKNGIKSTHLPTAKQSYPCQYCGHVFWRPFEKTRHERVHTGEKPYACEICGKQFRVPYSLTLHLRTHTDVRPFVCPTCNKRFKSHSVYTHHLNTHLSDRLYCCDVCQKSFRTSVQLNAHKNSHTKPFNCTICSRPFASLHAVKVHMKSHEKNNIPGNAQHSCYICGAVYARSLFLRAHLKDHHAVESTTIATGHEFYEESAVGESVDESEADAVAAALITAAADAEAREKQSQKLKTNFASYNKCKNRNGDDDDLELDQEYLRNELILDNFDTEETVVTGF